MLTIAILVQLLLMLGVPALLFWLVPARLDTSRALIGWGALTFVLSQAARWPFIWALTWLGAHGLGPAMTGTTSIALLCLTSGLFEEGARYIAYRTYARQARTWRDAVTFGLGHGGGEAIILGALVGLTAINAYMYAHNEGLLQLIPDPAQRAVIASQVRQYWAMPWYLPLLGGIERLPAICFHIAMSLVVLRAVVSRRWWLVVLAMAIHAGLNAVAVLVMQSWGIVATEAVVALLAVVALAVALRTRTEAVSVT